MWKLANSKTDVLPSIEKLFLYEVTTDLSQKFAIRLTPLLLLPLLGIGGGKCSMSSETSLAISESNALSSPILLLILGGSYCGSATDCSGLMPRIVLNCGKSIAGIQFSTP